jgi:L-fuconolactonase
MQKNKSLIPAVEKTTIEKVDSHQHFWELSRGFYDWLTPDIQVLYKDYLPECLAEEVARNHVNETILVQASATEVETLFLLEVAEKTDFVAGVVGWIDMESQMALSTLDIFAQNPYFKGIRPMLQDMDDVDWILDNQFVPIFDYLWENNLTFDALVREHHLTTIDLLAKQYPFLKIAINHCAKPNIDMLPSAYWNIQISQFKALNNVSIKLSGLVTEASNNDVNASQISPYFDHIMSVFGSTRIMFGSDWPVLKLNSDYDEWVYLTHSLLRGYPLTEQKNIWANNARIFYNLSPKN